MYNEKIKCMICGKETTQINHAHLKTHNLTSQQYREMFPEAKMRVISQKTREAASKNITKRNKSDEGRKKSSEMFKGKEKSKNHKQALKEAKSKEDKVLRASINGDNRRGKKHSKETIEYISKNSHKTKIGMREDLGHSVRSTWEANFARVLKHMGVDYVYEPKVFWLTQENGEKLSYLPDFYLPKTNEYIEIKGYWREISLLKFNLFKEQYLEIKIKVVDAKEYKVYENRYKDKIKNWE